MNSGYIAITNKQWFSFHRDKKHREVVFWRQAQEPLRLRKGSYFFFLVKKPLPRQIWGYGTVRNCADDYIFNIWGKFKEKTGYNDLNSFAKGVEKEKESKIGYYELDNLVYFKDGLTLDSIQVQFDKHIVSGKSVEESIVKEILSRKYEA